MNLTIPELALVVLIGPSGAGKSTFARSHFAATEVLSSDSCRGLVADDENDQSATEDAFAVLHTIAAKRLARGRLTVIDATNVRPEDRKPLVELARRYHVLPVAVVLDLPPKLCHERNQDRPNRRFGIGVVRRHSSLLRRSLRGLQREGFRRVHVLRSPEQMAAVTFERQPLWTDKRQNHGPFDIIGDVHGCCDELETLLAELGYAVDGRSEAPFATYSAVYRHPEGRTAVFLGDLVDRGPRVLDTLQLVRNMTLAGSALCIPGNHDVKLVRKLRGRNVQVTHGLAETLAELEALPAETRAGLAAQIDEFLDGLISHYVLDGGKLVVAHAGMKEEMQGRASGQVREFALYGETTGETDEYGLPVRHNWAADYRGDAVVVYGHTPTPEAEWLNRTINIDTGCVFGGRLTALRYPELALVSVPAARVYAEPARPLAPAAAADDERSAQQQFDDLLDVADLTGKRILSTRLAPAITISAEHAAAALEAMGRFAIDPKWLIYLPPTMSPSTTSDADGLLEHPAETFGYFRQEGVASVICQEKHMGSRAVVIVCRDGDVAVRRFGVLAPGLGVIYTRTGRSFFNDPALEEAMLARLHAALTRAGLWEELATGWICLDCELMPWSAKAQALLQDQYAPVATAGLTATAAGLAALAGAASVGLDVAGLQERWTAKQATLTAYRQAYQHYCWPVTDVSDLRLAPFHVLASEGAVHTEKDHHWHMDLISRLVESGDEAILQRTDYCTVDLAEAGQEEAATAWWAQLTDSGGEGMVVKPLSFIAHGKRGLVQPALKCRGRDYLRIIYGPEYTLPENLAALRKRGVNRKRNLARLEFALGVESLTRFVQRQPLRRVHECVFGVLALESEPLDPTL